MNHYLRPWDECRGDENADWGTSLWYFETDDMGNVVRQVESYECGKVLKYDAMKTADEYGALATHPLDLAEFEPYAISPKEFEDRWLMETDAFIIECVHEDGSVSWWYPPVLEEFLETEPADPSNSDTHPI